MQLIDRIFGARCRYCRSRGVTDIGPVAPTHPASFHTKSFALQHCRNCDVVYLSPLPTSADLKLLYEDSAQFTDDHYTDPAQVEKILDYYGSAVRNLGLAPEPGGRMLEIGAGLAWVSRACKAVDPDIFTLAQDVSSECAKICPWVDRYFVGSLDALPDNAPYQMISLTHVLEHLVDPGAVLKKIGSLLAPGGRIFITAPFRPTGWQPGAGIDAWLRYSYLHVPAHVTYFSRQWFERAGHANGLIVASWDNTHEDDQAFELVLRKA
ncbi:MAG TPA: class I SAM-dependent methyltransferase [Rudaea sp.]|jgi:SAM-dependent methyltransferase|uniref:class I SAM-dependent methyltransferase n=1 Tax=Rudaea sp. TaxID=2136325 RepID=UPI002F92185E